MMMIFVCDDVGDDDGDDVYNIKIYTICVEYIYCILFDYYHYYYTLYSRDLRFKETMMDTMMKLPNDMFRLELLPYLTVDDIVKLDNACMNHKYRPQLLDKISGVILIGDKDKSIKVSLFKWLGMRRIHLINMKFIVSDFNLTQSSIENYYIDQFRYIQHIVMRGAIDDDMAIFIISHCSCLLSIGIDDYDRPEPLVTDHTLQSIAKHCSGRLQSLSLICCRYITDTGLITISMHCHDIQSLNVMGCDAITDASIISISTHCTGLQSLSLWGCDQISDASIISISEICTRLKGLNVSYSNITDASLIAIAKNCTGLQYLFARRCLRLSSDELRHEFKSISKLRAVLLSIYPSLSI